MKNMKINFVDNVELKYKVPEVPKGAMCYAKHFYELIIKNIPNRKLIKLPIINS
tara:strand:+ start:1229 stop:1390 length:162 start_codon:yes stop_codon:yes gene_type:complete